MKYLGIDFGIKRIGIALSDAAGAFAFPRETIPNDSYTVRLIADLVAREGVEAVVMGDTRAYSGEENTVTADAERFAHLLEGAIARTVFREREAGSSIEASRYAPDSVSHDDSVAAAIILQRYLDAHSR